MGTRDYAGDEEKQKELAGKDVSAAIMARRRLIVQSNDTPITDHSSGMEIIEINVESRRILNRILPKLAADGDIERASE